MSEAVATPATPAAAPAPAASEAPAVSATEGPAPKSSTPAQRLARAAALLSGSAPKAAPVLGGVSEAPAAEAAEDVSADGETVEETPAPAAAKVETTPEQRAGEGDEKYAARLAKAISDLTSKDVAILAKDNELKSERQAREAQAAELKALAAKLDAISKDPIAALKAAGTDFDTLTKMVIEGKLKPPSADDVRAERQDETTKTLEAKLAEIQAKLDAKEAAEREADQKRQADAARADDLGKVKAMLPAEKYPLVEALGAHDAVLDRCYSEKSHDVAAQAAEWEKAVLAQIEAVFTPQVLAALEQRSQKIRETVKTLKGVADQSRKSPVSREGPRVLAADTVSAPTTPVDRPKTEAERRKSALSILLGHGS